MKYFAIVLLALSAGCLANAPHEHPQHDAGRLQQLIPGDEATYEAASFQQVGLLLDTSATTIEVRADGGVWQPVDITWEEDDHKVARVLLDEPATKLELRADQPWTFGTIQFYDHIVASETLARDLPVAQANPAAIAPANLVITRAAWGARSPNKVCGSTHNPYRMAIHHTASPADDGGDAAARMRQMQAYHIDSNGWCDIGYHFVVSQAGAVYQGRSSETRTGAHVGNGNSGNIGICLIGNFEAQNVSDTQLNKAAEIVGWVGRTYDIPFNRTAIKGHREHAGQSTSCPGANLLSKLDTLIARAENPAPAEPAAVAFEVNVLGGTDLYQAGSSSGKPDYFPGETFQAEIKFKNTTTGPLRGVEVGYWFESPHLVATNYTIESDAPSFDGATFSLNDANDNPDNPDAANMGTEGVLGMYAMAAGETKRIVVDITATEYSIGLVDHPDVRGWVRHVDDLYGEQNAFDADPTNTNAFEGLLQGFAQTDVLSRSEWQFDGGEPEQLEGWFGCGGVTPTVDIEAGALIAEVGASDCVEAPAWTLIDAETWDQLVLRMTVNGTHEAAVYWAAEGQEFSEERAVSFEASEATPTYVVPVGDHALWTGEVARLRITPAQDGATMAAIDAVFVQSSSGEVGSKRETFVPDAPVSIGGDVAPPAGEGTPGTDGENPPAGEDAETPDAEEFRVKSGCSTVSGSPSSAFWLFALVFALRRRRS